MHLLAFLAGWPCFYLISLMVDLFVGLAIAGIVLIAFKIVVGSSG